MVALFPGQCTKMKDPRRETLTQASGQPRTQEDTETELKMLKARFNKATARKHIDQSSGVETHAPSGVEENRRPAKFFTGLYSKTQGGRAGQGKYKFTSLGGSAKGQGVLPREFYVTKGSCPIIWQCTRFILRLFQEALISKMFLEQSLVGRVRTLG